MSNSSALISNLENVIGSFRSGVHVRIEQVDTSTANIQATTHRIYESVAQFRQDMIQSEEVQLAHENVIRIDQVLKEQFGDHETVRRTVIGVVRDFDINLVRNTTIQELSEELWITSSRYWLSYALMAITAWVNDYPDAARNALYEAARRDPVKASLFFTLMNLRFNRQPAAKKWFAEYMSTLDPTFLQQEAAVMLQAFLSGLFGRDKELEDKLNRVIASWVAIINDDPAVEADLVGSYGAYIINLPARSAFEYPAIREFCQNSSELEVSYAQVSKYQTVLDVIVAMDVEGVEQTDDNYKARADAVLTSLISDYDAEESELRSQQEYYGLIIKNSGVVETAEQQYQEMLRLKGEGFNIGRQMIGWVLYDNDQVDAQVRKFGLQNTKAWFISAIGNYSAAVKNAFPGSYRIKVDVWEGASNGEDQAELVENMRAHFNANKFSIMYVNPPNIVALALFVISAGLAFVNPLSLVVTAAALAFLVFNVLRANKSYPARIEAAVANLTETMEQITDFRRFYRQESEKRDQIVERLNFI
ncbi:MAG: hypothetical protein U1E26_08175 [Coriobacteriia bacterium]|nr:hypothetical protein [Coriobacteriia bacterium]